MIPDSFFEIFTNYFGDGVLKDGHEAWDEDAMFAAAALARRMDNLPELAASLREFLATWDRSTVLRFIETTNIDWLASEKDEDDLRYIIAAIASAAGGCRPQLLSVPGRSDGRLRLGPFSPVSSPNEAGGDSADTQKQR